MKVTVAYERLISTGQYENKRAKVEIETDTDDFEEDADSLFEFAKATVHDQLGIRLKTVTVREKDDY